MVCSYSHDAGIIVIKSVWTLTWEMGNLIKERGGWLSPTVLLVYACITNIYTIPTTKYVSSLCFSRCQYRKQYSKKNKMVIIWDYKSTVQTTPYPSATTCRAGIYSAAGMTMAASLVLIDVYTVIHFCCYTNQPKSNHN